jgi:hypothetical protein
MKHRGTALGPARPLLRQRTGLRTRVTVKPKAARLSFALATAATRAPCAPTQTISLLAAVTSIGRLPQHPAPRGTRQRSKRSVTPSLALRAHGSGRARPAGRGGPKPGPRSRPLRQAPSPAGRRPRALHKGHVPEPPGWRGPAAAPPPPPLPLPLPPTTGQTAPPLRAAGGHDERRDGCACGRRQPWLSHQLGITCAAKHKP